MPTNRWLSLINFVERASHCVDARACVCTRVNGDGAIGVYARDNGHTRRVAFRACDAFVRHTTLGVAAIIWPPNVMQF